MISCVTKEYLDNYGTDFVSDKSEKYIVEGNIYLSIYLSIYIHTYLSIYKYIYIKVKNINKIKNRARIFEVDKKNIPNICTTLTMIVL